MTTETKTFATAINDLKNKTPTTIVGVRAALDDLLAQHRSEVALATEAGEGVGYAGGYEYGRDDARNEIHRDGESMLRERLSEAYIRTHPGATSTAWWFDTSEPWRTLAEGIPLA